MENWSLFTPSVVFSLHFYLSYVISIFFQPSSFLNTLMPAKRLG